MQVKWKQGIYLGLPLGITKPRIEDYLPLVTKCETRLACTSTILSQAGKLEITNDVLTALPTYLSPLCPCSSKRVA